MGHGAAADAGGTVKTRTRGRSTALARVAFVGCSTPDQCWSWKVHGGSRNFNEDG